MKHIILTNILYLFSFGLFAQVTVVPINENWQFRQVGEEQWHQAEVPGTLLSDLYISELIEQPSLDSDDPKFLEIQKEEWEYRTTFYVDGDMIVSDRVLLNFKGLVGNADVFLNDSLIVTEKNKSGEQADVSEIIIQGDNELRLYFHSADKKSSNNDDIAHKQILSSIGIRQPIVLKAWNTAFFHEVSIEQQILTTETAALLAQLEYESVQPFFGEIEIKVDGKSIKKTTIDLRIGTGASNITFNIENPHLWWPNGMGSPNIYHIEITLKKEGQLIDSTQITMGLRTIELVQDSDKHDNSLSVKVNNKPVYIKGALYNPDENLIQGNTEFLLQSIVDADMNMVCVESGTIFQNDSFYTLCDEKGLMLWQITDNEHISNSWSGSESIEISQETAKSFVTDFGVESLPDLKTLEIISKNNVAENSAGLIQQYLMSSLKEGMVEDLMLQNFEVPKNNEEYILLSQMLQGEAVLADIKSRRTDNSLTRGVLLPEIKDNQPAISESLIDFEGRLKASYFYAKRAFADVITTFEKDKDILKIHAVSDLETDEKVTLLIELTDMSGKVLSSEEKKFKLKAHASESVWKGSIKDLLKKQKSNEVYLRAKLQNESTVIAESIFLFGPYKSFELTRPEIKYDFVEKDGKLFVTLKSNKTAFCVYFDSGDLDPIFSDNYFTLFAKEEKTVEISGNFDAYEIKNKLTVKSLADSF